ncbi:hypothetical protein CJP74_07355 [Psittacicella melopsittaci]|uniref:Metallo-beta-lactamase domain-containing protein n=1 Tax=Psittacicella melopsittaci TaxID=2028576 RepID=A0A3A1XZJ9_9GAMM|nr:MBL fold metallo-hydrolase [Psittacicella melopsittaci]RIY31452.1 hypothetical protein CJP74_07355 [Psittacicella melopsittaci]
MTKLDIYKLPVGTIQQNCRIFVNPESKEAFVVDPGAEPELIYTFVQQHELKVTAIVITHGHFDHIGGITELRAKLGDVPVYGPFAQDQIFFDKVVSRCRQFGLMDKVEDFSQEPSKGDRFFSEGEKITLAGQEFTVLFTPGHSPGHATLVDHDNKVLIVGDVLFHQGIGRTDLEGGSFAVLENSIQDKLYTLEGDYLVLPGHGPDTSLDYERHHNPFVKQK